MTQKLGIGIIGTGRHGSRYANHIVADLGELFTLAAISRRSPEARQQADSWHTTLHADWRELVCSSKVDAVISAATPDLNPVIAGLCAEMKKPLLLEKPLTTDYHSAQELVAKMHNAALPLTIAQTLRYNTIILGLRENLSTMGKMFSFFASQRLEPSTLPWLEQPDVAGGGVIFHTAVHLFDAIRFITGEEIVRIRAHARKIFNSRLEDLVVAEVVLSNGSLGIIDASKVSPSRAGRYEFVCEKAQLQGDQIHGVLEKIEGSKLTSLPTPPLGPTLIPLLEDWHSFLIGTGKNPIPGKEGLAAVKICHACRKSVITGRWVDLDSL